MLKTYYKRLIHAEAGVRVKLAENGIDASSVCGLEDVFTELKSPFNGLETEFKQEKYSKTSLNILVSLTYIVLPKFLSSTRPSMQIIFL